MHSSQGALQGTLRHPKINSMSKSDTRLHEINRYGNGVPKNRPASMDLLLLHTQHSPGDLRPSHGRQLPQIPNSRSPSPSQAGPPLGGPGVGGNGGGGGGGEIRDHTYTEVGIRNNPTPSRCLDDGLYESVGVREGDGDAKMPPGPPPTSASTLAVVRAAQTPPAQANGGRNGNGNGSGGTGALNGVTRGRVNGVNGVNRSPLSSLNSLAVQDPAAAEYASIRKFRKGDKATRKENNATDSQSDSQSSVSDSPSAHPPPPLHRSQELPRKPLEPFHLHSFPKEAVFIGNGEQYIWKPPEDDDIITLHPPPHLAETRKGQPPAPTAKEIADTYSTVCKPLKKKPPGEYNGAKTLPRSFRGDSGRGGNGCSRGRGVQAQARSHEEPCQPSGAGDRSWSACVAASVAADPPAPAADPDPDSAYANINPQRKREPPTTGASPTGGNATLKRKKPIPQPPQPPPLPPPLPQQQKKPAVAVAAAAAVGSGPPQSSGSGGENYYESISDVKSGASSGSSGTTTIFTFNDGMEMYVTGL
ncbi:unnamed protein product [Merluccius merluccius]